VLEYLAGETAGDGTEISEDDVHGVPDMFISLHHPHYVPSIDLSPGGHS